MVLERKVNYKDIERLGLVRLFDARIVREAVLNEDKNSLRELIFQVVEALNGLNIRMENFYYGEYIAMSDDLFDMFKLSTIKELFETFGCKCEEEFFEGGIDSWAETSQGYLAGKLYISKDNIRFVTDIIHTMHDSLISMFVDTKNFEVLDSKEALPFNIMSHSIEIGSYNDEALLVLEIESLGDRSNKIKNQRLELHFEEESRVYICSMVYNLSDKGYNPSEGRYRKLNVREIEYLRKYINDNVLNFII